MTMFEPPHPGEVVMEVLIDASGVTITEAAQHLGVSRASLSKILNGRGGLSPEMAVRLSIALGTSSEMWLKLQFDYDLCLAEASRKELSDQVTPLDNTGH